METEREGKGKRKRKGKKEGGRERDELKGKRKNEQVIVKGNFINVSLISHSFSWISIDFH